MKKIIILLYLLLFLLVGIRVYSQEPTPTPSITSYQQQSPPKGVDNKSNNNQQYTKNSISINKIQNPPKDQQKTNSNRGNQNDKSSNDGWITTAAGLATVAIAIFALVQIIVMWAQYSALNKQVVELRKSVNVTKEAVDAAQKSADSLSRVERAYLFARVEGVVGKDAQPVYGDRGFTGNFTINANILLSNHGKTPAVITSVGVAFSPQSPELPKQAVYGVNSLMLTKYRKMIEVKYV